MKAIKTLTSAVVAAALVGGIGLAYAQSGTDQPTGAGSGTAPGGNAAFNSGVSANQAPAAPMASTTDTSNMSTTPSTDSTGAVTERPAQADRN